MSTVIFDFDGTIADSFGLAVDIFHQAVDRENRFGRKDLEELRALPARQVIKRVGVRWWQVPYLLTKGRKLMKIRISEVHPFAKVLPVLEALHKDNHDLMILTSNSPQNVEKFLRDHRLTGYFSHIYGNAGLFGKAVKLRKIVRDNHLHMSQCWYVGDEVRDITASHTAKMRCIAVSWGYNTAPVLKSAKPFRLIEQPKELLDIIGKT